MVKRTFASESQSNHTIIRNNNEMTVKLEINLIPDISNISHCKEASLYFILPGHLSVSVKMKQRNSSQVSHTDT